MSVETADFIQFAERIIQASGRRVADADEWELAELIGLEVTLERALQTAVDGMRARDKSWEYIAQAMGVTRQNAYHRFGGGKAKRQARENKGSRDEE